jgi:hypothetical protein
LYRALNPKHLEDGLPGDNHFVMRQTHPVGDGVSAGIVGLVSLEQLRALDAIRRVCGNDCGVAQLNVAEVLAPVGILGIAVTQRDAPEWGTFARAHAVVTGYQRLIGNAGKRQIRDFQRHLVKLARKHYYPAGMNSAVSAEQYS